MSTLLRGRAARSLAGLTAGAVATAGLLAISAAPAHADTSAPVLKWEISQRFDDHLSTHVLSGGATEDAAGVITFQDGVGYYDPKDGSTWMSYTGSVSGSFVNGTTTFYTVTLADPIVTINDTGAGSISALVSAWNAGGMGPEASTTPARVVVTRFTAAASTWTTSPGGPSVTATPDWAGVLPADSAQAQALGIPAGKPVDGKAFAASFLGQLTPGVRAHFYASGSASDATKAPSPFTLQAPKSDTTLTSGWTKQPKAGKKASLEVSASGVLGTPTGQVTVALQRKGAKKVKQVTATLANGAAVLPVGKLKAGRWTVTVSYAGDGNNKAVSLTDTLRLEKR